MKKIILSLLMLVSALLISADKTKKVTEQDVQAQMEKADKIESYKAKKDVAWHKTEYNKVLKYLNKRK